GVQTQPDSMAMSPAVESSAAATSASARADSKDQSASDRYLEQRDFGRFVHLRIEYVVLAGD
ncbi:MAG TPA: hypothetical protein VG722_04300, partial [Tepidisphaeraceae bacterium]|nr:hypothetical protein [Tepidisphaeraceae bacterium]